jgi:hypothetical protein
MMMTIIFYLRLVGGIIRLREAEMRPDIIFCLVMLVVIVIYALRHDDLDDWRGH